MTKSEQTVPPELLPCPFCGATHVSVFRELGGNWIGECHACGTDTAYCDDEGDAIAAWNRRAPTTPGDGADADDAEIARILLTENARLTKKLAEAKDARDASNSALGEKNIIIENLEDEIKKLKAENDGLAAQNDDWQRLATTKDWK